jgi:hypothetical protein
MSFIPHQIQMRRKPDPEKGDGRNPAQGESGFTALGQQAHSQI